MGGQVERSSEITPQLHISATHSVSSIASRFSLVTFLLPVVQLVLSAHTLRSQKLIVVLPGRRRHRPGTVVVLRPHVIQLSQIVLDLVVRHTLVARVFLQPVDLRVKPPELGRGDFLDAWL